MSTTDIVNHRKIGDHATSGNLSIGRVPSSGVGAVGKWPAGATAKSLA
jgi:hypothetical protein